MPNNYFTSDKVKLYPSAYRGYTNDKLYNPESRLPTENNLSNISYYLTQKRDGFVVEKIGDEITFVLKGYHFKVNISNISFDFRNPYMWVVLKLKARGNTADITNTDYADYSLDSLKDTTMAALDDSTDFCGLAYDFSDDLTNDPFSNLKEHNPGLVFSLCIYNGIKGGSIPEESKLTISSDYIENHDKKEPISALKDSSKEIALSIKTDGSFNSNDLEDNFTPTTDTKNAIHVISDVQENSVGKVTPVEKALPLASSNSAGLVSADTAQTFSGIKTFENGLNAPLQYGNFAKCSSQSADTKEIEIPNFPTNDNIPEGVHIKVLFDNENTSMYPALKINNNEAVSIRVPNFTNPNLWEAGSVVEFVFYKIGSYKYWTIEGYTTHVENADYATNAGTADDAHWADIAGNAYTADKVNHTLTINLNGSSNVYDGSVTKSISLYAPSNLGSANQVLISNGSNFTWASQSNLSASHLVSSGGQNLTVGTKSYPVYFNNGVPTRCSNLKNGYILLNPYETFESSYYLSTYQLDSNASIDTIADNQWWTLSGRAHGTIGINYTLNGSLLRISIRINDISEIFPNINTWLRMKWTWLVDKTIGLTDYSPMIPATSYNTITVATDVNNTNNVRNIFVTHINADYAYIANFDYVNQYCEGANIEICMRVQENS